MGSVAFRQRAVLGSLVLAVACSSHSSQREKLGATAEPLTAKRPSSTASVTFDLVFPHGYGLSKAAVGASDSLRIGRGARILAANGSPGAATNAGPRKISLEERAQVGALVSVGDIKIERHAMVAQAISGGTVTLEKGACGGQVVSHAMVTPLAKRSISVPNLVGAPADFTVGNGSSATLAPGPYRKVEVEDHATLTVSAGIYEMESFNLERFGDLMLDTSAASVTVYVRQSGSFDGTESGDAANLLYTYLGTQTLRLKSNFRGTALAPSGTLDLSDESPAGSGSTPGVYHGTFYGKDVIVDD